MEQPNRHYIRCGDCLSIGVIEGDFQHGWHCNLCAGNVELMGRVIQDKKVETTEFRSACDRRCTHAVGPVCTCKCDCANHGTGRVVEVKVVNNIPTVDFISDDVAVANVTQFKQDLVALRTKAENLRSSARDAGPRYYDFVRAARAVQELVRKMVEARTWKSRHAKVAAAQAITVVVPQEQPVGV